RVASVTTEFHGTLSRYSATVQPASARSPVSWTSLKLASCQTDPLRTAAPGMLPTTIETLALAVWVGLFQATTPVFVTTVPSARPGSRTALNLSVTVPPGARGPLSAPKSAVIIEPATLTPAAEPFIVAAAGT